MKRKDLLIVMIVGLSVFYSDSVISQSDLAKLDYLLLAESLIEKQIDRNNVDHIVDVFSKSSQEEINTQIDSEDKKIAFWVNVYNGYIQYILYKNPEAYEDRNAFFKKPQIKIAGRMMSFSDIEHGILRRSAYSLFLGYLSNPFAPDYQKKLRVEKIDFRIHFALNCGAKSCPPVTVYHAGNIDAQLDFMAGLFLKEVTTYNEEEERAYTTALFSWFRGDFNGPSGIRDILAKYAGIDTRPKHVRTTPYDWTLALDNFRNK